MKKTYYKPIIEVVKIQARPLLTASETLPVNETPVSGGSSDAKGGMFWSDDDFAYEDYEEE